MKALKSLNFRRVFRGLAVVTLVAAVTAGGYFGWNWYTTPAWPELKATADGAPPVVVEVDGRDYAYRTGDLVNMRVFVKREKDVILEPRSLTVSGDFELTGKPNIAEKVLEDGSTVFRLDLTMQSFKVAPKQTLTASFTYKRGDTRAEIAVPATDIYTSNTYDGRKNLMEGPDPRVSVWWYGSRFAIPLVVSSIIYLILLRWAVQAWLVSRIKPVVIDHARVRATAIVDAIKSGSAGRAEHLELDGLVRDRFKIGPVPVSQLPTASVGSNILDFLKLNEPAIYAQDALDTEGRAALVDKCNLVLRAWK